MASRSSASSPVARLQNGRHERMHLTLKTRPPGTNSLQQQGRFDAVVHEFNTERPHEALARKCPAELYVTSPRRYDGLPEPTDPIHDRDILVTACGRICLPRKKINISTVPPARASASRKSTTASGSSASAATISEPSTWSRKPCNPSTTPFGPRLSPMS